MAATDRDPAVIVLDYGHALREFQRIRFWGLRADTFVFEITYAESKVALDNDMVCCNGKAPGKNPSKK